MVDCEINLTCDTWQASNSDGYFAVTGHWVEERVPGKWKLEHVLLGFTQMNTSHNVVRSGQALYKICNRLKIVHNVDLLFPEVLVSSKISSELDAEDIVDVDMDSGEVLEEADEFSWDKVVVDDGDDEENIE